MIDDTFLKRWLGWRRPLISLVTVAVAGCQSADLVVAVPTPNPSPTSRTACQQADAMWNDKIMPSRYAQLPALTSPGILDLLRLITGHFSVKALSAQGDELEEGRHKLIHAFGAEARFRLVISPEADSQPLYRHLSQRFTLRDRALFVGNPTGAGHIDSRPGTQDFH